MTRYLSRVRYTLDGPHGLLAEGGTKRRVDYRGPGIKPAGPASGS